MKNLHRTLLKLVLIFFLFTNSTIFAQGDDSGTDKIDEEYFFDTDEVELKGPAFLKPEFHGHLSVGALASKGPDKSEGSSSNTFDQTQLTLWFGTQILEDLSFDSEFEIENGFEKFEIEKFELDWNIFNERCVLRMGKFYYPFGIERLMESSPYNKLVDRPLPSVKIIPGTYSDEGLKLYGTVPFLYKTKLKYEFALTNGLSSHEGKGEQHLEDNNDNKALGGRIGIELLPDLEIGGSYSTGKYDDDEKFRLDFVGADLSFRKGGFEMRGEYIRSNVERPTVAGGSFDREGYYVQTSYKYASEINYVKYVECVARFDSVDPNDLVTNDKDTERISLGINYSPMQHNIIKLQYEREKEVTEDVENKGFIQIIFRW